MWKLASPSEEDIFASMEQNINANFIVEETNQAAKKIEALEQINLAATLMEEAGKTKIAAFLTQLIVKLANDLETKQLNEPDKLPEEILGQASDVSEPKKDLDYQVLKNLATQNNITLDDDTDEDKLFEDT